ncbi:S1C family serine protease [Chloroflexota bacterium]
MNKVIIVILVFLVVLSGGLGYYSYTLNLQIDALSQQLTVFHGEQTARISGVRDSFTSFRGEALTEFGNLKDEIGGTRTEIGTLEDEIGGTQARIGTLEGDIAGIKNITAEFSPLVIDASKVYQKASPAAVRINNGDRLIGSGFLYDAEGHVVTAHHVVEGLSTIYVVLADGSSFEAAFVGSNAQSDVAVLTIDIPPGIEPLTLADLSVLRVGQAVAAIGHPFDLTETLTTGIISQMDRFVEVGSGGQTTWVANLIQFDAAVNYGNSGGPLLNSAGEVIGLVIARVDPDQGDGVYYAVSANKVKRVAAALIEQGHFDYPWVGVRLDDITPKVAQDRGLETTNGVIITEVLPDTPADAGGVKNNDIIVAADTIPMRDLAHFNSYVGEHKSPDEILSLSLMRGTIKVEVSVKLGKRP